MSRDDRQERAEDAEQREADDPLVQLERKLRDGKSVDVQDVRRAWRTTRYPRAMVQVLARFFGMPFSELDTLATEIRRVIPDPAV